MPKLAPAAIKILMALADGRELSGTDIIESSGVRRATIYAVIRRLGDENHITIRKQQRGAYNLTWCTITPLGQEVLEAYTQQHAESITSD